MVRRNITDSKRLTASHLSMEEYDALPLAVRRLLQDAPINLSIFKDHRSWDEDSLTNAIKRDIPELIKVLAIEAYGHDHPQAR